MTGCVGPRGRRGGLFVLAIFLMLSGVLRAGLGVERALASGGGDSGGGQAAAPVEGAPLAAEGDNAGALLAALRAREKRVSDEEKRLAERSAAIEKARAQVEGKIAELKASEERLSATITQADKAAERDVGTLVSMYENMKPKDAARLFSEMEPAFAAGFLERMQAPAAAAVLAGLEPAKAYAISAVLAGQNARAPKD